MSLWVDKYRPTSLSKLDYHIKEAACLRKLVEHGDFPHLLFFGPSGSGKKTRIMCLLKELYGNGVERLRIESHSFQTPSNKKIEIETRDSNYHIEVNPSDAGIYDRVVIQELVKEVAKIHQLDSVIQKPFKVILILEADKLTKDAQHALRRTMEKHTASCRLILCCIATSRLTSAIRSRCLPVRVAAPQINDIKVCKKEGLSLPSALAHSIAEQSGRNLRRALLMCETCRVEKTPLTADQEVSIPDWQKYVKQTSHIMLEEQSPKKLQEVRQRLYELLGHCIPPRIIIEELVKELILNLDGQLKSEVIHAAAYYEHRLQLGTKPIFHLEAFVARFFAAYRRFIEDSVSTFF